MYFVNTHIFVLLLITGALLAPRADADTASNVDGQRLFTLKVLPLLKSKCFACHGEDPDEIEGDLNMLSRDGLLRGGESGDPALTPGQPGASVLVRAIEWDELEMPPKENDRLTAPQIALVRKWVAAGAPWPNEATQKRIRTSEWSRVETEDGVLVKTSGGLSEEWTYRRYDPGDLWAYQPIRRGNVPNRKGTEHPIDAFVGEKLQQADLAPAVRADRRTLVRRATFDLTGLPPSPDAIKDFSAENSGDDAWQRLIRRLLDSPHYGERMAQHWLDVVRYADTSGYANDWERPHAWRYRDYVIRSFNHDKPFDQFVIEQIAGDELDPKNAQTTVAAGFLRMGPWEHTAMSVQAVTRQLWLDDVTNSVGETFLGHALRCAKCHDHKFDPIPTRDYYSMQAVFAGTQFADQNANFHDEEQSAGEQQRLAAWEQQFSEKGLEAKTQIEGDNALGRIKKKLAAYRKLALERYTPKAFSVTNAKPEPKPVAILIGGALESPGEHVVAGVLSALPGGREYTISESTHGRRLALARWIASADNPLTARVIVNRVWQWHFGRGLVATPNNLGKTGGRPSHPELLDFLADWFITNDWSIKKLHELIMTSECYRRASEHQDIKRLSEVDPDDTLLARFPARRLTAEELRDTMLAVTGELSRTGGGPGVFPEINWEVALQPRHIMGGIAPPYRPSLTPELRNRRTIYAFRYRGLSNPMLEVFNRPNADLSCERRDETTVATQAFALFNGRFTHNRALALAARLTSTFDKPEERIRAVFHTIYGRQPSADEQATSGEHFQRMLQQYRKHAAPRVEVPRIVQREMIAEQTGVPFRWQEKMYLDGYQADLSAADANPEARALADVCLVLFNSSEFLYVY